ncbi:unnamed protein product [Hymenolepis diminuta]|uniref:Gelsolin-like domain-containing protein n=1 Tax=Hymenolepis diminuta TaxID=6216 RepID=A0A564Y3J3_HYMDI|nr:unnamed protein product [Hymenolepis diminuta]
MPDKRESFSSRDDDDSDVDKQIRRDSIHTVKKQRSKGGSDSDERGKSSSRKENGKGSSSSSSDEEETSDLEERYNRALKEKAWEPVTKVDHEQFMVWRLEGDEVKPLDLKQSGVFFSDVIYIVLKAGNKQRRISYDLHFWVPFKIEKKIPPEPPQKVKELAALLHDNVILHKEVEYFESSMFKSYFKTFIVFHGSPSSGFNDKEPKKYKPRLMRFKLDKNRGEFREVEASRKALNSRGVYVIDKGLCMLQWNGRSCSEKERAGASHHIENLLLRRKGKLTREFYDEEDLLPNNSFTDLLNDDDVEKIPTLPKDFEKTMLRLSNEEGVLKLKPIYHGRLARRGIEPSDVNFMDTADGLYIYVGPTVSKKERNSVWKEADKYLESTKNPTRSIHYIKAGQKCYEMDEIWDDYN